MGNRGDFRSTLLRRHGNHVCHGAGRSDQVRYRWEMCRRRQFGNCERNTYPALHMQRYGGAELDDGSGRHVAGVQQMHGRRRRRDGAGHEGPALHLQRHHGAAVEGQLGRPTRQQRIRPLPLREHHQQQRPTTDLHVHSGRCGREMGAALAEGGINVRAFQRPAHRLGETTWRQLSFSGASGSAAP
jgi:hypothetical protein